MTCNTDICCFVLEALDPTILKKVYKPSHCRRLAAAAPAAVGLDAVFLLR